MKEKDLIDMIKNPYKNLNIDEFSTEEKQKFAAFLLRKAASTIGIAEELIKFSSAIEKVKNDLLDLSAAVRNYKIK